MSSFEKNLELSQKAQEALAKTRDPTTRIKLRAIASVAHHPVQEVADIIGVSRQTIWRWMKNFRERGLEGLQDRPKGHRRPKLTQSQLEQIAKWLSEGKTEGGEEVNWTLEKLQDEILKRFNVKLGITPLWRWVRKMGFEQREGRYSQMLDTPPSESEEVKEGDD